MKIESRMCVPIFVGDGELRYEDRPVPRPQHPDDVLVAVEACGICGTDLNILAVPPAHRARPGIVLGHEAVGTVVEVGPGVQQLQPGQRVVVAPRLTCGQCRYCRRGLDNQCENYQTIGTTLDGAFAPYLRAPERALYPLQPQVPLEDAAFFEPLSCVVGAMARVPIQPGDRVAILGAGPMGALFALMVQHLGAGQILVTDVVESRLAFARRLGIHQVINPQETALKDHILATTEIGCDLVVDAVGNQMGNAIQLVRRGGQVLLFGLRPHENPSVNQYTITRYDLTVTGAFVGNKPFMQTLQLLESGTFHPGSLITHRLPLSELAQGVALMREGTAMKVVIEP